MPNQIPMMTALDHGRIKQESEKQTQDHKRRTAGEKCKTETSFQALLERICPQCSSGRGWSLVPESNVSKDVPKAMC